MKITKHIFGKVNLEWVLVILPIALVILFIIEANNIFKSGWHSLTLDNSLFYALFGILVGFLTLYGLLLTYRQLKLMEDRIDSYEDFYKVAIKLLKDEHSKFLHFSGSTLIPGHISFGDENYVGEHGQYCKCLEDKIKAFHEVSGKKESSKFILPDDYSVPYKKYLNKQYRNFGRGIDFDGTEDSLAKKEEEIRRVQNILEYYSIIKNEAADSPFLNNFYLSNGKTMIFAISITHEQAQMIGNDGKRIQPAFVGFKTQKSSIIEAFEERFNRQFDNINES